MRPEHPATARTRSPLVTGWKIVVSIIAVLGPEHRRLLGTSPSSEP